MGKKLSLKYFYVWLCLAKAKSSRPNKKKLDSRMVSYYFIGYYKRSREYNYIDPITKTIFESKNEQLFENVKFA